MTRNAYLTPTEVAERLHVSVKTISRWAKEGKLPNPRELHWMGDGWPETGWSAGR